MIVSRDPLLHLTYCLNIHRGESWAENLAAIRDHALRVRRAVAPGRPFGLGLRLGHQAAEELAQADRLAELRGFLAENDLYAFTVNGFPYGPFHGTAVKEDVYRPDWRTAERRDYTIRLIDILAALLPEGVPGSISTVPGAYKAAVRTPDDVTRMCRMLAEAAAHAERVYGETGRDICIALEPEPDCFLETADEAVAFFGETLPAQAARDDGPMRATGGRGGDILRERLGVCLDTAHAAVEFEDPAAVLDRLVSAGVRVGKVQLSAALRLSPTAQALRRLGDFADAVYLHQVKLRGADGAIRGFADLPEGIAAAQGEGEDTELRVHFHVPLFFVEAGGLASTSGLLGREFWAKVTSPGAAPTGQLEIETYTFDVLPAELRLPDVADSVVREYEWVLERI
ncbi:MAG TPA: metabolite traffic protein EboE [Phycisphaerae bacterium]|nr:metabolite traffic protein EboE [Phycisphaerae bacterium]